MRHSIKMLIMLLLCPFGIGLSLQAQNTSPASGGVASGSGGTVSYTVGQIVYTKNEGSNGSVFQGVQQPFEISVITAIKDANGLSLDLSVFPNPATDFIRLKITSSEAKDLRYQLYDITGNILLSNIVEGSETNISMQNFQPGTYFLKISRVSNELKTFKIIKK